MPLASALTGTEIVMVLQNGQNKKTTLSQIINLVSGSAYKLIVEIPSTQVLNIHLQEVDVIPSPGPGKYNRVIDIDYVLKFLDTGGVAYVATGSPVLQLYYGTGRNFTTGFFTAGSFMDELQSKTTTVAESTGMTNVNLTDLENKPITVRTTSDSAFWTVGNGILRIIVSYMIVDI